MTTIVVAQEPKPLTVLFDGETTTVIVRADQPTSVVSGQNLQTVIFNTEGPMGDSADSDPGDLLAAYTAAKD